VLSDPLFRLRALFRSKILEAELDEELRLHFDLQVDKYLKSGMPQEEAYRRARLAFGGLDQVKEQCRDARGIRHLESLVQDIRYGFRMLRKSPAFTAVTLLTLAVGISFGDRLLNLETAGRARSDFDLIQLTFCHSRSTRIGQPISRLSSLSPKYVAG
jgi:hypothetical protein